MKKAQVTPIDGSTYRFTEKPLGEAVYMYLLIGSERALLIDTGYGLTDEWLAWRRYYKYSDAKHFMTGHIVKRQSAHYMGRGYDNVHVYGG